MALKLSAAARNARLDAIETLIGVSPILKIRGGSVPANVAAADSADAVLATLTLPSDWMGAASAGAKAIAGTWQDASADATGTAAYFRIYVGPAGTVAHIQGT